MGGLRCGDRAQKPVVGRTCGFFCPVLTQTLRPSVHISERSRGLENLLLRDLKPNIFFTICGPTDVVPRYKTEFLSEAAEQEEHPLIVWRLVFYFRQNEALALTIHGR